MVLQRAVEIIDGALPESEFVRPGGSLLMMAGLPGTGKSSIVSELAKLLPFVHVSTDGVRLRLREQPTYTAAEMTLVYEICFSIIERRLRRGQRVVFDASNYLAARREHLVKLAQRSGAPVAVCLVQASQEAISRRLFKRSTGQRHDHDLSDADWAVYQWMVEAQEPVVEEHIPLDTTYTPTDELARKLYEYWLRIEASATSDPDLQSPGWAKQLGRPD
ncbi:MAG: AAA family ATPase [Anaerolineae bacterium]